MFWVLFQRMETCFEEEEEQVTAGSPPPRWGTRPPGREEPGVEGEDCGEAHTLSTSLLLPCLLCASARAGTDENHAGGAEGAEARGEREMGEWIAVSFPSPFCHQLIACPLISRERLRS